MTIEEIKQLTEYQKEVFVTKDDFEEFKVDFTKLQTTIDIIAKDVKDIKEDKVIMNNASPKLGLEFKH